MKEKIAVALLLIIFLTVTQLSTATQALSCVEPDLPHVAFDNYDAVIVGHVKSIRKKLDKNVISVEVKKSYKGITSTEVKIYEDFTWGESKKNNTYLYFLKQEKQGWSNPLCSPSTSDLSLSDKYLSNKTTLPLQDNQTKAFLVPTLIIATVSIFFIVVVIIRYKKKA